MTIIITMVATAVNNIVGLRRLPKILSDIQPPKIDPINPPTNGIAATNPIFTKEKPFSFTKYDGIHVNIPYRILTIIKYATALPMMFFDTKIFDAVSIGFKSLTLMNLSNLVNLLSIIILPVFSSELLLPSVERMYSSSLCDT